MLPNGHPNLGLLCSRMYKERRITLTIDIHDTCTQLCPLLQYYLTNILIIRTVATECTLVANGQFYTGTVSHTKSGLPCQRWDSQTPHPHGYNDLNKDENYCRNTDGSQGPWCYTQDPDTRWELCDVPRCGKIYYIRLEYTTLIYNISSRIKGIVPTI